MKQSAKLVRMSKIEHFIQQNDVESFRFMNISKQEVMSLRFKNDMNMLQVICSEEAIAILDFVRAKFSNDKTSKQKLAQHRDKDIGSQAIHLAAATGNRYIIEVLMLDFESDPYELTTGN